MSRSKGDIDPTVLELDVEHRFIQSSSKTTRRVKLNRGDSWLGRFLPARLGPKGLWYARVAKHWVNQKPIICPRNTSTDFGGDPDAYCPACDMAAELNDSPHDAIRDFGFRAAASAQWLTFCLIYEKSSGGGKSMPLPSSEALIPYEFNHYKGTFEELMTFYRNNVRRDNPHSVLDYLRGSDFWISKTAKGLRLDKQDPLPIFEDLVDAEGNILIDPATDPRIKKIEEQMRMGKVVIPTEQDLKQFAEKMHEAAFSAAHGGVAGEGRTRSARSSNYQESSDESGMDEQDTSPPPRRAVASPGRRVFPAAVPPDDDQIPGAEMPADQDPVENEPEVEQPALRVLRPGTPAPSAASRPASTSASAPVRSAPPAAATPAAAAAAQPAVARPAPAPRPPARPLPVPLRSPTTAPAASTAAAGQSPAAPKPAAAPRAAAPAAATPKDTGRIDEEEQLPEEPGEELAPPAENPLPETGADQEEPPPPVERAGSSGLASRIQSKLTQVRTRPA